VQVTQWFVAGTVLVYVMYVAWVFLGDEWHARGRPELRANLTFNWSDLRELLLERCADMLPVFHTHCDVRIWHIRIGYLLPCKGLLVFNIPVVWKIVCMKPC
jgi:hypothetical protein